MKQKIKMRKGLPESTEAKARGKVLIYTRKLQTQ